MSTHFRTQLMRAVIAIALGAAVLSACNDTAATSNADLLKQAVANMKSAGSYTLGADFSQSGQEIKLSGQVDVQANSSALVIDSGGQKTSLVTIGNDVYVSTDGGA